MKISNSILKNLWLFAVVLLIMVANGLPVWALISLSVILLSLPLYREFHPATDLDERQITIGHFSSHIAFYAYLLLMLIVISVEFISKGENPDNKWYMLLIVPLLIKFFISLFQNYGPRKTAQLIGYFFASIWLLFATLSHGVSFEGLIEFLPFIPIYLTCWAAGKWPLIPGIGFLLIATFLLYFFGAWMRMDIYGRVLMYSLIPLPLYLSGLALIFKKEE